jgi:hypothetical protein
MEDLAVKAMHVVYVAAFVLSGCMQLEHSDGKDGWVDRTYRTGSNIPAKSSAQADGVAVVNKDDVDTWRSQNLPAGVPCSTNMGCGGKGK